MAAWKPRLALLARHIPVVGVLVLACFWGCPSQRLFGISCPGCGLTRAWLSFFQGDWRSAAEYHLFFLPVPVFLFLLAHRGTAFLPASRRLDGGLVAFAVVLAAYQVWRTVF